MRRSDDKAALPESGLVPAVERWGRGVDAVLLFSMAVCLCLVLTFSYGRDQGIYAVVARTILEGGMPYRDAWDFKPPGIYLVYALVRSVAGGSQLGIRVFEVLGLAVMARGLVVLARRWWGQPRIGLLAAAFACLVHAQLDFWHTAQPESFGGMLTVWGLVVATHPARGWRLTTQYILAGVLFGGAGLLKPPLAGAGVVVALAAAGQTWLAERAGASPGHGRRARGDGPEPDTPAARPCGARLRRSLLPIGAVLLGGVVPFAACLAWFFHRGALGPLHEALFVFTPHYTALGWEERNLLGLCYQATAQWLVSYSSLLAVGLLLFVAAGPRWWRLRGIGLLFGVVGVQLLGVALQGKFFPYHFAAVWPVTALVAALGWWRLWHRAARRGALALVGCAFALGVVGLMRTATKDLSDSFWTRSAERVAIVLGGSRDAARVDALASVADVDAAGNRAVAELLRAEVGSGQPVFIWGFEPVIYDMANVRLASHYLYNVPQRVDWAAEASRRKLMAELQARPPAAIVVAHNDLIPMVTGDYFDSAGVLESFPALSRLLFEGYEYSKRVQDFEVYLARGR